MEIKIVNRELDIQISESIKMYLAQMLTQLDDTTKKLKNLDEKWKVIKGVLKLVSSANEPFFLILPEIAVPYAYVTKVTNIIESSFPSNTITIFGIELISVKDCETIVANLNIGWQEIDRILKDANKDRPVNPCLIVVKQKDNKCSYFLQLKITPSKFEGALDEIENLLSSNFIYYFTSENVNFVTLVCSDFFNMPPGSYKKIIDKIDYEILKIGKPLDFIINIQYTPSPDKSLFLHSLNRVYDDGYKCHGNLCTIFLNSVRAENEKGGLSKILFYKSKRHKIPERQPLKQIDAPVVGYELFGNEMLICLSFDRLPKSWDPERDFVPLHFSSYKLHQGEWKAFKNEEICYIAPMEKETSLSYQSYEELAYKFSDLGNFDKAREYAEKAQRYYEEQKNYLKAASLRDFIAIQYRHQGQLYSCLQNLASAEVLIYQVKQESPESKLMLWRIKAGRVLVEDYLINGDCRKAYKEYSVIVKDMENYLNNKLQIDINIKEEIELYKIHAKRQQAEMLRIRGKYRRAYNLFSKVYEQYNYIFSQEKAYSALGQGDSLRMLGDFENATKKYEEAEKFARKKKDKRLLARVLRNISEIYRARGDIQTAKEWLDKLKDLSDEINYLFGKIYYFLISGGIYLKEDLRKAEEFFASSKNLTMMGEDYLKLEYAHSLFGIAEAKRLTRDFSGAEELYAEAHKMYEEMGILWGEIRTTIGVYMTSNSRGGLIVKRKSSDPIDNYLINELRENALDDTTILFLNIP